MALAAYRHLLRATRIAFHEDTAMLLASRAQARSGFDKSRSYAPDSKEATTAVAHAEGVAEVLMKNIVQGKVVEGESDKLRLRIHEHTERGDNDTVKNPLGHGGVVKVAGGS
jgi:complex III assembly factor LYRM7